MGIFGKKKSTAVVLHEDDPSRGSLLKRALGEHAKPREGGLVGQGGWSWKTHQYFILNASIN